MKLSKLFLLLTCVSLTSCGGGSSPTPTPVTEDYYITIDAPKENTSFTFVRKYRISEQEFYTSSYQPEYIKETNKYKIKITDESEFDIIVSCTNGYDIANPVFTIGDQKLEENIAYTSVSKYHVFEYKNLPQKNLNATFSYEVCEAKYDVTIGDFIAPSNTELFNKLKCNVTINNSDLEFEGSKDIQASKLRDALLSIATNNKISITYLDGIKLSFGFNDEDYFFNEKLNLSDLRRNQGFIITAEADYVDFKSEYTLRPKKESTLSLDFTNMDKNEYQKYSLKTYLGYKEINDYKVIVNGNEYTDSLTNSVIKKSYSVKLTYTKDALGVDDLSKYNKGTCDIAGIRFYSGDQSRLSVSDDTLTLTIKDTNVDPVFWYTEYLEASQDKRHNLIMNTPCKFVINIKSIN